MESIRHNFWCTGELALRTLAFLSSPDLRNCARVSQSFNRLAVQSVLDRYEIWNPEQNATLRLANNPSYLDGLSALLLSVHIKSLNLVVFKLDPATSLRAALKSFEKMQRLVERVESVHTVEIQWHSGVYEVEQSQISDHALASACRCMEGFLDTVIARGCTSLEFAGFDAFASMYKLKKNPAASEAKVRVEAAPAVEQSSSTPSIGGSAREGLPSQGVGVVSDLSSDETSYCRKSRSAPWISLAPPSPRLREVTKLARLRVSTTVLRPPFSQWLFGLLKASPVIFLAISFNDAPDNRVESKVILDRLAEVVPDVTRIHIEDRTRAGMMKDVVAWLGRFELLEYLKIEPECFLAAGNRLSGTDGDLDYLQALARLPNLCALFSSSPFLCAYLAARRSVNRGPLAKNLRTINMWHIWKSSTRSAISGCLEDVEQLCNAVMEACSEEEKEGLGVRVTFCFDCSWFDTAEALGRIWNRIDQARLQKIDVAGIDDADSKVVSPQEVDLAPSFRPSTEPTRFGLWLELHTTVTADEIQRGVVDEEVMAFCRMLPTLRKILLCSPSSSLVSRPSLSLRKERFDKFKSVCPELEEGFVF